MFWPPVGWQTSLILVCPGGQPPPPSGGRGRMPPFPPPLGGGKTTVPLVCDAPSAAFRWTTTRPGGHCESRNVRDQFRWHKVR